MAGTFRTFVENADRYFFDFNVCRGWPQIDTGQDASYYGTWCHPEKLKIVNFCEGDVHVTECEDEQDFISEIRRIKRNNKKYGWGFMGVDCLCEPEFEQFFQFNNASDLIH